MEYGADLVCVRVVGDARVGVILLGLWLPAGRARVPAARTISVLSLQLAPNAAPPSSQPLCLCSKLQAAALLHVRVPSKSANRCFAVQQGHLWWSRFRSTPDPSMNTLPCSVPAILMSCTKRVWIRKLGVA